MSWEFEFFAAVSLLITAGGAWAHLAVKLDRIEHRGRVHGRCLKRMRMRLAAVERWLPPRESKVP